MTAGPELNAFQSNLTTTTNQMETVRQDVEALGRALDTAATASQNYLNFRKVIKVLDAGFAAALTTLKLTENVAPLSAPSKALKDVLAVIQPRIADIKDQTDRAQKLEPILQKFVSAERTFENTVTPAVVSADETLDNILSGINEFVAAFDRVSTPNGIPALNPNAGTQRPGADDFSGLFNEADAFVAYANGANGAAQGVFDAYDFSKGQLDNLSGLFGTVDFSALNEIFGNLAEFEDLFDGLGVVLDIVDAALRPIQPLLDAVGVVFDTIVGPVIDFLKDELGIDDLFDALSAELEPLFPDIDLFDGFLAVVDRLEVSLDVLDFDAFEIPDFTDLSLDVFDRFDETFDTIQQEALALLDGIPLRIGDPATEDSNGRDIMYGTGGNEAFDPQSGDDEVLANAGNDIIVASAGEDTIDGGDGVDRLVFAGELAEYEFTREGYSTDPNAEITLIFTHTVVGGHGFNEGTEVVTNVEYFDFGTETFTKEQFENAVVGVSVLDGTGEPGARTTDEGELIFLNEGGTLVDGLTLNGETFDGMNVVYGLGGDDRIQGTNSDDFIFGGPGNDLLIPRYGEDALDGGEGVDTFQIFDLGRNPRDEIYLDEGIARLGGPDGTTALANVENVIVLHGGVMQVNGSDADNVLFTGRGRDLISGRAGNDAIFGNVGRDVLIGGLGVDTLRGGESPDLLLAGNTTDNGAAELYDGEEGYDVLTYSNSQSQVQNAMDNRQDSFGSRKALEDSADGGPLVIRAGIGRSEIDRLDAAGNVIATDIALNMEEITGSASNDVVFGGGTSLDRVAVGGGGGNDILYTWGSFGVSGDGGDDLIIVQRNPETGIIGGSFSGGSGFDTIDLRPLGDVKFVLLTNSGSGSLTLRAVDKDDTGAPRQARGDGFNVGDLEEYLFGDNNDFVEWGTGGDATIRGAGGDDVMRSVTSDGTQSPTFYGDAGNDTLILDNGGSAFGGLGDDRIEVNSSSEQEVQGNEGNDTFLIKRMDGALSGGEGYDTLILNPNVTSGVMVDLSGSGTATSEGDSRNAGSLDLTSITGIEALITTDEADTVTGSDDADRIILRGGRDVADGGGGNDQMFGGTANDSLMGGAGNDTIHGGTGNDTIDGGSGIDAVDYAFANPDGNEGELIATRFIGATVDLSQNVGGRGDEVDVISAVENVFGTNLNDMITGDSEDNVLSGNAGADTLIGQDGDDVLIAGSLGTLNGVDDLSGGAGDDQFILGAGAFVANGGTGSDTLDFSGGSDAAEGGGRSLSVDIDLTAGTVKRDLELGRLIWAEGGDIAARSFDGQSISPLDVLRSDPLYAQSDADLDLRLPGGDEDDTDIPSFAIEVETFEQSAPIERNAFSNIENVLGTERDDTMRGDTAVNTLSGAAGDDLLEGRGGNDLLEGGEGTDTAYFEGDQARYTLTIGPDGTTVTDRLGVNGTDNLSSIEMLDFDTDFFDGAFNLEQFGGLADLTSEALLSFIELYIAYFNRAPDAVGLSFWGTAFANGTTLEEIATLFVDQDETRATYPSNLSNTDFATAVYNNVLGRVADQEGFDFWVGVLNDGSVGRDQFILDVLGGAKADPPANATPEFIAQQQADRTYLANKTDIGTYFAVNQGMSDVGNAIAVMQVFDGSQTSIDAAVDAADGFYAAAEQAVDGAFLMPIIGILDDPFT